MEQVNAIELLDLGVFCKVQGYDGEPIGEARPFRRLFGGDMAALARLLGMVPSRASDDQGLDLCSPFLEDQEYLELHAEALGPGLLKYQVGGPGGGEYVYSGRYVLHVAEGAQVGQGDVIGLAEVER